MVVNSINIINNLPAHRAKIINILDFNSEKLSVICTLILVVRYQRVYLNTCWYDQFYNGIQIKDTVR